MAVVDATRTLEPSSRRPIGWDGRSLHEMLTGQERLFAETGRYWGLEQLPLQRDEPIRYEKMFSRLRGGLVSARETALNISASPIVTEIGELSFMLYTPEGDSIALSRGIIVHVHTASDAIKYMIRQGYEDDPGINPGDIFCNNDATIGDVHNADVLTIVPILIGWAAGVTHEIDIGAKTPGSVPVGPISRYEDGIDLPGIPLDELHALGDAGGDLGAAHPDPDPEREDQRRGVHGPALELPAGHVDEPLQPRLLDRDRVVVPDPQLHRVHQEPVPRDAGAGLRGGGAGAVSVHLERLPGRRHRPLRGPVRDDKLRPLVRGRRREDGPRRARLRRRDVEPRGRHGRPRDVGDDRAVPVPRPACQGQHQRDGASPRRLELRDAPLGVEDAVLRDAEHRSLAAALPLRPVGRLSGLGGLPPQRATPTCSS